LRNTAWQFHISKPARSQTTLQNCRSRRNSCGSLPPRERRGSKKGEALLRRYFRHRKPKSLAQSQATPLHSPAQHVLEHRETLRFLGCCWATDGKLRVRGKSGKRGQAYPSHRQVLIPSGWL